MTSIWIGKENIRKNNEATDVSESNVEFCKKYGRRWNRCINAE